MGNFSVVSWRKLLLCFNFPLSVNFRPFSFFPLETSTYWASNRDLIYFILCWICWICFLPRNLYQKTIVTQVLKHATIHKVMMTFFRIFQSNFTQGMRFFLKFGRTLNVTPLLAPSITSCYNVTYLSESTDQCIRVL